MCLNSTKLQFLPHFSNEYRMLNALVVSQVTNPLPNFWMVKTSWPHTQQLQLADPEFQKSSKIEILLRGDVFYELFVIWATNS